jgi:putative ABC transport system substrate-binding protein
LGWVDGKNVVFEHRCAENRFERLPELAADPVRRKVDVIAAAGTLAPLAKALGLELPASVPARTDENFQIKEESNE